MSQRKIIAAMRTSVDLKIEGPNGEVDWVGSWDDSFDLPDQIDTCILGGGMYPGYEQYWLSILDNPEGVLDLTGQVPTEAEIEYARFADRTPHVVLSNTLGDVAWETTRVVRDLAEIRRLKDEPGRDMYAVGGATLISSLMNDGLIDELRLTVYPLILGEGKALFKDVTGRHALELVRAEPTEGAYVRLVYRSADGSGTAVS
jgi:dihydrofolate reductase